MDAFGGLCTEQRLERLEAQSITRKNSAVL